MARLDIELIFFGCLSTQLKLVIYKVMILKVNQKISNINQACNIEQTEIYFNYIVYEVNCISKELTYTLLAKVLPQSKILTTVLIERCSQ